MFKITEWIKNNYRHEMFDMIIIYGRQGHGKSVYAIKTLLQLYLSWNKVKGLIVYTPDQFLNLVSNLYNYMRREYAVVWDDAGVFLRSAVDPLVNNVISYIEVGRTNLAAMLLTAPDPRFISPKLRRLPHIAVKVYRVDEMAYAVGYEIKYSVTNKQYVKKIWIDTFNVKLPDTIYNEYRSIRYEYVDVVLENIRMEIIKGGVDVWRERNINIEGY